jgi:hypothetical protein
MNTTTPEELPTFKVDWTAIIGEPVTDAWQEDRHRKFSNMVLSTQRMLLVIDHLEARGALYQSSPEVLRSVPGAATYYVALAGFSRKTLRNSSSYAKDGGLTKSPEAYVKALAGKSRRGITDADVGQFSVWVNKEICALLPVQPTDPRAYLAIVAMIEGPRIVGQNQNEGGNLAVKILKRALMNEFGPATNWGIDGSAGDDYLTAEQMLEAEIWRYRPTNAIVDFRGGGNRPDIVISREGTEMLVGEVKGRKDLSNLWESWMPQLADHLLTWTNEYPRAVRGVLMTLVNEDMIRGKSRTGVVRTGLRAQHADRRLHFAVNLSRFDVRANRAVLRQALGYGLGS